MNLRNIVDKLGGELRAGGTQANIPAPGHSAVDRSVSLRIGREGQVLVHSFAGTDWREVLDDLRDQGLIDDDNRPLGLGGTMRPRSTTVDVSNAGRLTVARRIWEAGRTAPGTLTGRHVALRRIERALPGPAVLRHLTDAPISVYRDRSPTMAAMLVAISDEAGAFTAVEMTYLDTNGRRTRRLNLPRKTVGIVPPSSAVRLDEPQARMLVGEGVFTALSASQGFDLPAWALLGTRNLRSWRPPEGVRSLVIAGDRGLDGEASAAILAARLRRHGLRVTMEFPPEPHRDWNEAAAPDDVRQSAPSHRAAHLSLTP